MADYRDLIRLGAAWLWADPAVDATTERVVLTRSGNDPQDLLPYLLPRPASGGVFLGFTRSGVAENWGIEIETYGGDAFAPPLYARIGKEQPQVETELVLNNHYLVRSLFEPPGVGGLTQRSFGGATSLSTHSLFVLIGNYWQPDPVWECRLYYRGVFEPAPLISGREFQPIRCVFRALAGLSSSGGCRGAGDQIGRTWWVRVSPSGTNTLVDPRRTEPLEDEVVGLRRGDSVLPTLF